MSQYAIRGRVIDAVSPAPLEDGLVVINGQRIEYVGAYAEDKVPQGVQVMSVENGTILPGFIDCHAHLTGSQDAGSFSGGRLFGDQLLGAAYQCGLLLDAGFTGIRDMSVAGFYLSRAVERGVLRGPKIMPGGQVLSNTSGHLDSDMSLTKEEINKDNPIGLLVDGPDDCMMGVRKQFRMGAKFIKICATGGVSSPTDREIGRAHV